MRRREEKRVLNLALAAVMAALSYVVFTFLQIKIPLGGGDASSFHLGNAVCVLAALLLGGVYGGAAGAIGMTIADVLDPVYVVYAPLTFILKFGIGLLTGLFAHRIGKITHTNEKRHIAKWTMIAACAGLLFNVICDPLIGYLYNIAIIGKNAADVTINFKFLTTGVNAAASVIVATVAYLPIRRALTAAGLFIEVGEKKEIPGKVMLINDLPGYGKVAIPAMTPALIRRRYEVFSLPTAVVSNTFNYGKHASIDTTEYMREAVRIWDELGFTFNAVATGYIANDEQAEFISDLCRKQKEAGAVILVDPIMADNGKLYNSITEKRVEIMKKMVTVADHLIPNITEASLLSGIPYSAEGYTEAELYEMAETLHRMGAGSVAITSARLKEASGRKVMAVVGYDGSTQQCFTVRYSEVPVKINGSGDTFASIVLAGILSGVPFRKVVPDAVRKVRKLILKNCDIAGRYNGLPLEADTELL